MAILLLQPPACWDHRCRPLCLALAQLSMLNFEAPFLLPATLPSLVQLTSVQPPPFCPLHVQLLVQTPFPSTSLESSKHSPGRTLGRNHLLTIALYLNWPQQASQDTGPPLSCTRPCLFYPSLQRASKRQQGQQWTCSQHPPGGSWPEGTSHFSLAFLSSLAHPGAGAMSSPPPLPNLSPTIG